MSKRPFFRLRCAICGLALLLLAVGWGYFVVTFARDYRAIERQTRNYAQTAALGLEEHTRRMLLTHDLLLLDIADHIIRGEHADRLQASLNSWLERSTRLDALLVMDADHDSIIASVSRDALPRELPDPPLAESAEQISPLQIAAEVFRGGSGQELLVFFRQVQSDERHFLVLGLLQVSCLSDFFQSIDLGTHGTVAILHENGYLLALEPVNERLAGPALIKSPQFQRLLRMNRVGIYQLPEATEADARIFAYRSLVDLPLMVTIGTSGQPALLNWQNHLVDFLLIQVMISLAVLLSTLLVVRGLTRIEQSERKLREREEHFRCVANSAVDAVITVNAAERVQFWSSGAERIFTYSDEEVKDRPLTDFFLFKDEVGTDFSLHDLLHGKAECGPGPTFEIRGERKDGWNFPTELSISSGFSQGQPFYTLIVRDVTERKLMEGRVRRMASHDNLTRLPNRGLLMDRLQVAMALVRRKGGAFALLFLDLDEFKPVNDTYGHEVGDRLLQQVADRLLTSVRESDTVARIGGDEFAVLLSDIVDEHAVQRACENILITLNREFVSNGIRARIGCSIGVVEYSGEELSASDLLRQADAAMYAAKRSGKNRYQFVDL